MGTDTSCLTARGRVLNFFIFWSSADSTRVQSQWLESTDFGGESTTPTQETELYREASRYIFRQTKASRPIPVAQTHTYK